MTDTDDLAPLEVDSQDHDGVRVLRLAGELDLSTADLLRGAVGDHEGPLVLDLAEVAFIDSSGVRALVDVSAGRVVGIHAPSEAVQRMLELTRLADRFPRVASLDAAGLTAVR